MKKLQEEISLKEVEEFSNNPLIKPYIRKEEFVYPGWILAEMIIFDFFKLFSCVIVNKGKSNPPKLSQTDETWTKGWSLIESINVNKLLYV